MRVLKPLGGWILGCLCLWGSAQADTFITHTYIKNYAQKTLTEVFRREVSIGSVEGSLLGEVSLQDVVVAHGLSFAKDGVMMRADRIDIQFNLSKTLLNRGNLVPFIYHMTVVHPQLDLIRLPSGKLKIFEDREPSANPVRPAFRGVIDLVQAEVNWIDYYGFGAIKPEQPFLVNARDLRGQIDYSRATQWTYQLNGKLQHHGSVVTARLHGAQPFSSVMLSADLEVFALPLAEWQNYLMPSKTLIFSDGVADGMVHLSRDVPDLGVKVKTVIEANIVQAKLTIAPLLQPLEKVQGHLRRTEEGLDLGRIEGVYAGQAFEFSGRLSPLRQGNLNAKLKLADGNLANLIQSWPSVNVADFQGKGSFMVDLEGPLDNLHVVGSAFARAVDWQGLSLQNTSAHFSYQGRSKIWDLDCQALMLGGAFDSHFESRGKDADRHIHGNMALVNATQMPFVSTAPVQEPYDIKAALNAVPGVISINALLSTSTAPLEIYQQLVTSVNAYLEFRSNAWNGSGQIILNGNPADLVLEWPKGKGPQLTLDSQTLYLSYTPKQGPKVDLLAAGRMLLAFEKIASQKTWQRQLGIQAELSHFGVDTLQYEHGYVDLTLKPKTLEIHRFELQHATENIRLWGYVEPEGIEQMWFSAHQFNLSVLTPFQDLLPKPLQHIQGILSGESYLAQLPLDNPVIVAPKLQAYKACLPYQATGSVLLEDALLADQALDRLELQYGYQHGKLTFNRFKIKTRASQLALFGSLNLTGQYDLTLLPDSRIDFSDFITFTKPLGDIQGFGSLGGHVQGDLDHVDGQLDAQFARLSWQDIRLQTLRAALRYEDHMAYLAPLEISLGEDDLLRCHGWIDCQSLWQTKDQRQLPNVYDLDMDITQADAARLRALAESISAQLKHANLIQHPLILAALGQNPSQSSNEETPARVQSTWPEVIYNPVDPHHTALGQYGDVQNLLRELRKPQGLQFDAFTEGTLEGRMRLQSGAALTGHLSMKNFRLGPLSSQRIDVDLESQPKQPAIIKTAMYQLQAGASSFEKLSFSVGYQPNGWLSFYNAQLTIASHVYNDVIYGNFPLAGLWGSLPPTSPIQLHLQLPDHSLGVLALLAPSVESIHNQGMVSLQLQGTLEKPTLFLNKAEFNQLSLQMGKSSKILSPLQIPKLELSIKDNQVQIDRLLLLWQGPETNGHINRVNMSGRAQIELPSLQKPDALTVNVALAMLDVTWDIDLPHRFNGKLGLHDLQISNAFVIPLTAKRRSEWNQLREQGTESSPLLAGRVEMLGGTWTLPPQRLKRIPLHLNLAMYLKNDLRVVGQFLGGTTLISTLVSDVDLEIEPQSDPLYIRGTWYRPKLAGTLSIHAGSLSMLNHTFEVLDPDEQRLYFGGDLNRVLANKVGFEESHTPLLTDETLFSSIVPYFKLVAKTVIDAQTVSQNLGNPERVTVYDRAVLVKLEGSPLDTSGIVFEQYQLIDQKPEPLGEPMALQVKEDQKKLTPLFTLLNPGVYYTEFFKELFQSSRPHIAELTESSVNKLFRSVLRPVERDLARNIGLYDIKLDYNLGRDVNGALGIAQDNSETSSESTHTLLGIDVAQNIISDRLFITLKTEIQRQQEKDNTSIQLSKYTVTYLMTSWLKLNYNNKQFDPQAPLHGVLSLEASLAF